MARLYRAVLIILHHKMSSCFRGEVPKENKNGSHLSSPVGSQEGSERDYALRLQRKDGNWPPAEMQKAWKVLSDTSGPKMAHTSMEGYLKGRRTKKRKKEEEKYRSRERVLRPKQGRRRKNPLNEDREKHPQRPSITR